MKDGIRCRCCGEPISYTDHNASLLGMPIGFLCDACYAEATARWHDKVNKDEKKGGTS